LNMHNIPHEPFGCQPFSRRTAEKKSPFRPAQNWESARVAGADCRTGILPAALNPPESFKSNLQRRDRRSLARRRHERFRVRCPDAPLARRPPFLRGSGHPFRTAGRAPRGASSARLRLTALMWIAEIIRCGSKVFTKFAKKVVEILTSAVRYYILSSAYYQLIKGRVRL